LSICRRCASCAEQARAAQDTASRLGAEGAAAAIYFAAFPDLLPSPFKERFAERGCHRKPPRDPVNALLSFLYSLLAHEATVALLAAGLSPAAGVLHVEDPRRPALALDLMEPFRPLVADSLCITLLRTGEPGTGYFHDTAAGCVLTEHGRKVLFAAYGRRLDTEITHPTLGYSLTYRRMLHLHAWLIRAWIEEDIASVDFLRTR
jgi:CRISPR-associated endonuclease Cas1